MGLHQSDIRSGWVRKAKQKGKSEREVLEVECKLWKVERSLGS